MSHAGRPDERRSGRTFSSAFRSGHAADSSGAGTIRPMQRGAGAQARATHQSIHAIALEVAALKQRLRAEDTGFATSAPKIFVFIAGVDASRDRVFAAIVADPRTWKEWCPGVTGGSYASAGDHGVGATRFLGLAGTRVQETYRSDLRQSEASAARAARRRTTFGCQRPGRHEPRALDAARPLPAST
jgi:hypothetical protein